LRFAYEALLRRIGSTSTLENRRTQDMLLTVNNIVQGRAQSSLKNLITKKRTAYNIIFAEISIFPYLKWTLPGTVLSRGVMLQQSTGTCYLVIFVPWQAQKTFWKRFGKLIFTFDTFWLYFIAFILAFFWINLMFLSDFKLADVNTFFKFLWCCTLLNLNHGAPVN